MARSCSKLTLQTPIVVFGDDWGRHVSTMQHLFRHVAKEHTVVWVNAIGHRIPRLRPTDAKRAWQKLRETLRGSGTSLAGEVSFGARPRDIILPKVLPWHHRPAVLALNTWSLVRAIRSALGRLGLREPPLLVTGSPPSVGVVGRLGEVASVYFCMDDFLHLPNVSADMLEPLERRLLDCVDAMIGTARILTESKRPRSGRVYYLPQGVNYEHFALPRPVPPELEHLPRPRIGFAGGLTTPVDLALLRRVANSYPEGSIVLVGPVGVDEAALDLPNIHLLGPRSYRDLPAYVQAFDVGIVPYLLNDHTVAVDPLKLLEYLAVGIPVVATDLPEVRKYSETVAIAATHDEFVAAVGNVLKNPPNTPSQRQAVAQEHGWGRRADELVRILAEVVDSVSHVRNSRSPP